MEKKLETLMGESKKMTRREFIQRAAVFGISMTAAANMWPISAKASTPKRGGHFKMGLGGGSTTDSLAPYALNDDYMINVNWQLRNNLVEIDHNFKPIPELAKNWEPSPDAKTWVFNLRKGVEFHSGKTFGAEDVLFSINLHRGEQSKSPVKSLLAQVKDIKTDGQYRVIFDLKAGNADFPFILSDYHIPIVPNNTTKKEFEEGVGTGPYALKVYEPGVRTHAIRNKNYWKQNRAFFDEVETLCINDSSTRNTAVKTGEVDHINRCELKTARLLDMVKGVSVLRTPGTYHFTMPMLTDTPPFNNNDVRLGLKYAVDREQLLKLVFRGFGSIGNDHPIAKVQRYYGHEIPQRQYDPDKARYHMKKAGLENTTFKLYTSDEAGFKDSGMAYKESAAKAGINIELDRVPVDGYWTDIWRKKPFCSCYWGGRPTSDWMFSAVYAANASWNDTHWKNERFNHLLKEARAELNEAKRREMYVEMQRIVRDDGGAIVYVFQDHVEAIRNRVEHGPVAGNWQSDGGRNAERWWFKS